MEWPKANIAGFSHYRSQKKFQVKLKLVFETAVTSDGAQYMIYSPAHGSE